MPGQESGQQQVLGMELGKKLLRPRWSLPLVLSDVPAQPPWWQWARPEDEAGAATPGRGAARA